MANLALGRRIVDNLLEFTNSWFFNDSFQISKHQDKINVQNKEHKKHDWINHHMNEWNTTTQNTCWDRKGIGLLTQLQSKRKALQRGKQGLRVS